MPHESFSDAALIVLGHGSTRNSESSAPVFQHAAELRRRRIFADVQEAFWKQEPLVKRVLARVSAQRVFVVPLFISEGYFSANVIPGELGIPENSNLFYCKPVGTHPGITNVLLARAHEVVVKYPFPRAPKPVETTLFIAGHGTEQDANSRRAIEQQVELIRAKKEYSDVQAIFMEENPRIGQCYALARTRNIVVVPFFVSDGMHTQEDIPVLLGEPKQIVEQRLAAGQPTWRNPTERNGKLVWFASAVGTAPEIAEVIFERVREAARQSSSSS